MVKKFVKKRWQRSDGNPLLYERDPFLVDKLGVIVFAIWLTSIPSGGLKNGEYDIFGVAFAIFVFIVLIGFPVGFHILKKRKKEFPGVLLFPGKFWSGLFFYLSFLVDIGVPFFFFIWIHLAVFEDYVFSEMILAFDSISTVFFGLLISMIYLLVFIHGFPTETVKAMRQFFVRVFTFGLIMLFNENIFDAFFMYGLFEVVSLCVVCAAFFLVHHLFKDPEGNANRVFEYDLTMILVAVTFGAPMLLWGAMLYVFGFLYVFAPTLEYNVYVEIIVWIGLVLPVLFTHFQSLRNYSVDFYMAIPKD